MKKAAAAILIIILLAAAVFWGMRVTGQKEVTAETEPEKTVIYFFHNNPCESCREGEKFRDLVRDVLTEKQDSIPYQVEEYFVYGAGNKEKLSRLMEERGISQEEITYPLAIIGNRCLIGYTQMEEELYDILKAAAEGSGGAVVTEETAGRGAAETGKTEEGTDDRFRWKTRDSIHMLLFTTESCSSCEKAKEYLAGLPGEIMADGRSYPVELEEISVMEEDNAEYLMELFDSFQVPSADQKVPVIFIGTNYLAGEKQICSGRLEEYMNDLEGLGALYLPSGSTAADGMQTTGGAADKAQSENGADSAFGEKGFLGAASIGSILLTGLLNGLNPCALSIDRKSVV